jgi:imidazolonepropionase-like amidohydrolase
MSGHICVGDSADARHVVDSLKSAGADFIKTYSLNKDLYFVIAAEARRVGIPIGGHLTGTPIDASDSGVSILDHIGAVGDCLGFPPNRFPSIKLCQPVAERFKHNGTWWVPTLIRHATSHFGGHFRPYYLVPPAQLEAYQLKNGPLPGIATEAILKRSYQVARNFWDGAVFHTNWLHDPAGVNHAVHTPIGSSTGSSADSPADSNAFLNVIHLAGVPILAGTDAGAPVMEREPPGFSLHTELAMYAAEGLTPLEALQTATLNPAQYLHGTDSLGTVAPGKLADLVLLDADPLVDIANTTAIRAVVANGRYYDRSALDKLLADAQAKAKQEPRPLGEYHTAVLAAKQPPASAPLVLDSVTVIDVEQGRRLPAQRVVIQGNRIHTMGSVSAVRIPTGAQVVDARGKYLIPGLWDIHVHPSRKATIFNWLFLANGVTGIRDAGSPVPLDTLIQWRREILTGIRLGPPRQILSGQSITDTVANCDRSQQLGTQTCVASLADAMHYVDSLKVAGADMIKPRDVSRATWFAIAAEARRIRIPFGGHAQFETAIEASDSGARIVDHMQYKLGAKGLSQICWGDSATVEHCQPVAEKFRHNGTWLTPTLFAYKGGKGKYAEPISARLAMRAREFWDGSLLHGNWLHDSASSVALNGSQLDSSGAMRIMQRVGLPILAGTDVSDPDQGDVLSPGLSLHAELAMYVAEGLTPLAALQSATLNPAKLLHATDSLGTVASGKLADLLLLDADPLTDITNTTTIRAVIANGRYFDRAALDQLLTDVQAQSNH